MNLRNGNHFVLAILIASSNLSAAEKMKFTPQAGFGGKSEGNGSLKILCFKPQPFHVQSNGSEQRDGTFRLDQRVTFEGKAPKDRFWIISTVSQKHYTGTLSDASGRVTGNTSGTHLSLRYRVKGPVFMHQELEFMPDGKSIDNIGTITLLGIPIGHLHENITPNGTLRASSRK